MLGLRGALPVRRCVLRLCRRTLAFVSAFVTVLFRRIIFFFHNVCLLLVAPYYHGYLLYCNKAALFSEPLFIRIGLEIIKTCSYNCCQNIRYNNKHYIKNKTDKRAFAAQLCGLRLIIFFYKIYDKPNDGEEKRKYRQANVCFFFLWRVKRLIRHLIERLLIIWLVPCLIILLLVILLLIPLLRRCVAVRRRAVPVWGLLIILLPGI